MRAEGTTYIRSKFWALPSFLRLVTRNCTLKTCTQRHNRQSYILTEVEEETSTILHLDQDGHQITNRNNACASSKNEEWESFGHLVMSLHWPVRQQESCKYTVTTQKKSIKIIFVNNARNPSSKHINGGYIRFSNAHATNSVLNQR